MKLFLLDYTQLTKSVYDSETGTTNHYRSFFVNAPVSAYVSYCDRSQLDYDIPLLFEPAEYRLWGCGKKYVQLDRKDICNTSQPISFWFSADSIDFLVVNNGKELIFYGDDVVDGVFTADKTKRYRMKVTGDGIAYYIKVDAFPIPIPPYPMMLALTDEDLPEVEEERIEELEAMTANARAVSVYESEEITEPPEGGTENDV